MKVSFYCENASLDSTCSAEDLPVPIIKVTVVGGYDGTSTITFRFTEGTDLSSSFSNDSNATDGIDSTWATGTVYKFNRFSFTTSNATSLNGVPFKVEIGLRGKCSSGQHTGVFRKYNVMLGVISNTSNSHTFTTTNSTSWYDITVDYSGGLNWDNIIATTLYYENDGSFYYNAPMIDDAYIRITYLLPKHPRVGVGIHNNPCIV